HTCARTRSGGAACWGSNSSGELGSPTSSDQFETQPVPVQAVAGAAQIAVGTSFACVRLMTGGVLCWGANSYGQLGDSTNTPPPSATDTGLAGATFVPAGTSHACVAFGDGTAACTGFNLNGQLGDDTMANRSVFTTVKGLVDVGRLALGDQHSCALSRRGIASCWGLNNDGQLGTGQGNT